MTTDFFSESVAGHPADGGQRPLTTLEVLDDEYWALTGETPAPASLAVA